MNGREIDKLCYSRNEQKTEILLQEVIRKHPMGDYTETFCSKSIGCNHEQECQYSKESHRVNEKFTPVLEDL